MPSRRRPERPPPRVPTPHCAEPIALVDEVAPGVLYSAVRHCPFPPAPDSEYCDYHLRQKAEAERDLENPQ